MVNGDREEKEKIPFVLKMALSLIIIIFLGFSVWFKIDYFMNFNSSVLPETHVSAEVLGSDSVSSSPETADYIVAWSDTSYFFISEYTFSSPLAGVYAARYLKNKKEHSDLVTAFPRIGVSGLYWSVGFGQFGDYQSAESFASSKGIEPGTYEILHKEIISPDALAFNTAGNKDGYYTIQFGVFESLVETEAARQAWSQAGFAELQITDKKPYSLSFGKYRYEAEAALIANLIWSATGKKTDILLVK